MTDGPTPLTRTTDPLAAVVWGLVGWLVAQFLRRYRSRMVVLRWQAQHYPLGLSSRSGAFGQITVLYQGNAVQNLYATVIELQNPSYSDLTDLELNAVFHDGCSIYAGEAQVVGSEKTLFLAQSFVSLVNAYTAVPLTDPKRADLGKAIATRRDFHVRS